MAKSEHSKSSDVDFVRERVAFWRLTERTVYKWLQAGVPLDSVDGTIAWFTAQPESFRRKVTKTFVARVKELRGDNKAADERYTTFEAQYHAETSDTQRIADLRRMEAFARYLLNLALKSGDEGEVQTAVEKHKQIADTLRREEAADAKLGRELGDQLSRAEVERIFAAHAAAIFRCIDASLPGLCRRLLSIASPEQVRAKIEPELLSVVFLRPLAESVRLANDRRLPPWAVEAVTAAAGNYIDNGRDELKKNL